MLFLRTAAKERIKTLLLLLLPSLAMQQKARGNRISEFFVWLHLDLLGTVTARLFWAFLVISIQRCCFQREIGSLPSPFTYKILEAEAAVEAFKENMEKLAREQGKRRADLYFATVQQNPSDILRNAYNHLIAVNKFDEAFPSLEDYQLLQAQAAVTAFKEKVQQEGKQKVDMTFVDTTWRELEGNDMFSLVGQAHEAMAERYPRSTGDRTQPYVKERDDSDSLRGSVSRGGGGNDIEMFPRA
ncbi:hypothetical protein AWC38_SpisGene7251 [Stylophora pistillata]|uniref:Uncharacterized protein n=1 Tax=Stylophora pistillata TaxID=50429 RepID=A0A2B4SHL4_STYPI|nr:hypothetical protein AWC38_SpisGene7251 [Stylophora pistillata]